jgi:hypothetical protein
MEPYEMKEEKKATTLIESEEFMAFIGAGNYLIKWQQMIKNNSKLSGFNFWAALFGPAYFFYRKMYTWGMMYIVAAIVITFVAVFIYLGIASANIISGLNIQNAAHNLIYVKLFVWLLMFSISGVFANVIYYRFATFEINALNSKKNSDLYFQCLKNRGGVSMLGFAAGSFINILMRYI